MNWTEREKWRNRMLQQEHPRWWDFQTKVWWAHPRANEARTERERNAYKELARADARERRHRRRPLNDEVIDLIEAFPA